MESNKVYRMQFNESYSMYNLYIIMDKKHLPAFQQLKKEEKCLKKNTD